MTWGPAGPASAPPAKTAPHGPATGDRQVSHPKPTGTRARPRPIQVNRPSEPNACQPDGPDSDLSIKEYSTETSDGQVQIRTRFARCNNLEQILCELKAAINTNIAKPHKRTPNFATLRSLWLLHPFPTHVLCSFTSTPRRSGKHSLPHITYGFPSRAPAHQSSIYMWAYTGENIFSSSPSKNFPGVISHMVLKGGVQGFNISIYFQN